MRARRCASTRPGAWACASVALLLTVLAPGPTTAAGAPETSSGSAGAVQVIGRNWPVGTRPTVLRGWEPPATPYGPGHRGVDLAAAGGVPVRAVAAGRVSFAGRVAGRGVVSVELTGTGEPPLRTTYEPVRASVRKGDLVGAGQVLGAVEPAGSHCAACLHWGLLRGDTYLDPLSLLPPWLLNTGPSRLLPVLGVPLPEDSRRLEGREAEARRNGRSPESGR
ncbi:murein hydrolase activator EnvC family protein [Streptomyces mayonensis]|uniref:murein hydrolase activator EnvC family protein n=1 Tax=Streptomyces mayonensis TaxID=2750816 RepID=UPI001C1E3491|nr:M23 family metallopeptidase [Streptomyces sp. A108]MBU6532720.1 M23 family metallopeptidase [Streptomyces sp. A108]